VMMAPQGLNCGANGVPRQLCQLLPLPYCQDACLCDDGHASSNPHNNCFACGYTYENRSHAGNLFATAPCDTPCDWGEFKDPYANYSCITPEHRFCPNFDPNSC
jgi:hypothetical protein